MVVYGYAQVAGGVNVGQFMFSVSLNLGNISKQMPVAGPKVECGITYYLNGALKVLIQLKLRLQVSRVGGFFSKVV
jgi:hypothetical protein